MELISKTKTDRLGNTVFIVKLIEDSGLVTEKTLTAEDYIKMLGESVTVRESMIRISALPAHYLDGAVSSNGARAILFYPAEKRTIVFGQKHWIVPFPNLIFDLTIKDGKRNGGRCFAIDTDKPNMNSNLFCYPFGNVSASGSICFGNIDNRAVNLSTIETIVDDFFCGVTNNDYYGDGGVLVVPMYKQEVLLEKLTHMDAFPSEWLKPCSSGCHTLGDLCKTL